MNENINALDEIHKGSCMGMDAIHFILDKVKEKEFKEILEKQHESYKKIKKKKVDFY